MKKITVLFVAILLITFSLHTSAQRLASPLDFPLQLSGGFGDLRADHYHTGIDFRTKSSEGHPLHAVLGGYISRVSVSPGGYGRAVYVIHPIDCLITVYGHLQRFTPQIADIVKKKQYENESFPVDITFKQGEFPVRQGDIIGFSGNSGNSGGPHLHFEVRRMQTNEWIDPLIFYQSRIPDNQKPQVRGLIIYPIEGKGMVNGNNKKQYIEMMIDKNEQPVVNGTIEAWGETGFGIRAVDRMDGTGFSYGIKDLLVAVDGREMFRSYVDGISPNESRYINSYTDYEEWSVNRSFYMKTFVDPGNNTQFIASRNFGIITINKERIYNVVFTLTDLYGNACRVPIRIKGKKQDIAPPDTIGTTLLRWYEPNAFNAQGIRMTIPRNSLYTNIYMHYRVHTEKGYDSPVHTLHTSPVPLHTPVQLSIRLTDSTLASVNPNRYGIVRLATTPNRRMVWIGGVYRDGCIDSSINELGLYTVTRDITPPKITPVDPAGWRNKKKINIRITDDLSGIASYRGEIDGAFVLFEYDSKNSLLTYTFDTERLSQGDHHLQLTVTDRCGNINNYELRITN